jgi:hypothetical protein
MPTKKPRKRPERLERAKGIEPSYEAWEAAVLPLNYARALSQFTRFARAPIASGEPTVMVMIGTRAAI